jgi:hypothetical protein
MTFGSPCPFTRSGSAGLGLQKGTLGWDRARGIRAPSRVSTRALQSTRKGHMIKQTVPLYFAVSCAPLPVLRKSQTSRGR